MRSFVVICLLAHGAAAHADVLYSTAPFDPELAFASDSVPNQFNNQRLAEAFDLTFDSTVNDVRWWGRSEGAFFLDLTNMESFTVAIYQDSGMLPGAQVFSATVPLASVNPTIVGVDSADRNLYSFDFGFGGGLDLPLGTYWLSVGTDNFDPNGDGFYWQASQQLIDGTFAADLGVVGAWETSGFADLAFEVNGVPEPTTLATLCGGLAILLRRRPRRSQINDLSRRTQPGFTRPTGLFTFFSCNKERAGFQE